MVWMINQFIAIIPARSGSKGLPRKNKKLLAGKPLILYTIEAAIKSNVFKEVIVSTDDHDIINLLNDKEYKSVHVDIRPMELASDTTEMFEVVNYLIKKYRIPHRNYITLLQPTSPLRDFKEIKKAIRKFKNSGKDALISVVETNNRVLKTCLINDDVLIGIKSNELLFKNRQSLPKTYRPNGAIYIYQVKDLLYYQNFHLINTTTYIMEKGKSLDIDDITDFEKIESILS